MNDATIEHPITLVHTETGMCLTTKQFANWREVQNTFDDYKASLGPYGVGLLRGRPELFTWAASDTTPIGAGLKLGTSAGDSLRLDIVGYQFPNDTDRHKRDSWYMVEGSATNGGQFWNFRWQALTCDAPPLICGWLFQLAAWVEGRVGADRAPDSPWLVEPNVQFTAAQRCNGRVHLAVELNGEFLPPQIRDGRQIDGTPEVLQLRSTAAELRQAAIDLGSSIARYPLLPSPSRPTPG